MIIDFFSLLFRASGDFVSHSQTMMTRHPEFSSSVLLFLSRSMFLFNFGIQ